MNDVRVPEGTTLIGKVGRDYLCVSRSVYKGRDQLSIRFYYDAGGELRPTKRGVNIPIEGNDDVIIDMLIAVENATGFSAMSREEHHD